MTAAASFEAEIAAIRARVEAELGPRDVRYIERVDLVARWLERIGRGWIITSSNPIGFTGGVTCLWLGKQLQATEIGHAALHGAYDRLPAAHRFHAAAFGWRAPIDRLVWPRLHDTGGARSASVLAALGTLAMHAVRATPYYARELVVLPTLAGPMWWKALLGHAVSEVLRDACSIAIFVAGHPADDATGDLAARVATVANVAVPLPISILCGGADRAIEHLLFPTLPPHRLREIAPEVRRVCEAHGVTYRVDGAGQALWRVFRRLRAAVPVRARGIVRAA